MSALDAIMEGRAEDDEELLLTRMMARLAAAGYRIGKIPATPLASAAVEVGGSEEMASGLLEILRRGGLLDSMPDMDYADVHSEIAMSDRGVAVLERYKDAAASGARQRRSQQKVVQTNLLLWFSENPDTGSDGFRRSPHGHYFGQQFPLECLEGAFKSLGARGLVDFIEGGNLGSYARVSLTPEGDACVVDFEADVEAWAQAQRNQAGVPPISNVFNSQVGNVMQGGALYGGVHVSASENNLRDLAEMLVAILNASALAGELQDPEVDHVARQVRADLEAVADGDVDESRLKRIAAAMRSLGEKTAGGAATALGSSTVQTLVGLLLGA